MDKTILLMEDSSDYNTPVDVLNKRDDSAHIRGYQAGRSLNAIRIETLEFAFAQERQSRLVSNLAHFSI